MNRLDAMTTFVRVAELGSFAAAAGRLGVAPSVITRRLAALEEHLGISRVLIFSSFGRRMSSLSEPIPRPEDNGKRLLYLIKWYA